MSLKNFILRSSKSGGCQDDFFGLVSSFKLPHNTPYVAYSFEGSKRLQVKKFQNGHWTLVGPEFLTIGQAKDFSLKSTPSGELYVAYIDEGNQNRGTVCKLVNNEWVVVGPQNLTPINSSSIELYVAYNGLLYVRYWDANYNGEPYNKNLFQITGPLYKHLDFLKIHFIH